MQGFSNLFKTSALLVLLLLSACENGSSNGNGNGQNSGGTPSDTIPDSFAFNVQENADLGSLIVSDPVIISGIDGATPITIEGGEYSIDGGEFTDQAGDIEAGQEIVIRVRTPEEFSTATQVTVTIGGVSAGFSVTTLAEDVAPDALGFVAQPNVERNQVIVSNAFTINGINTSAPISITGGEYSIDGGEFVATEGVIASGQTVAVRVQASPDFATTRTATLTIGGVSGSFTVTTVAEDQTPTDFAFNERTGVNLNSTIESNPITVSGINSSAPISINGGEYAIDDGPFTDQPGLVQAGQSVVVRVRSANNFSSTVQALLTVGDVSGAFAVTTLNEVIIPPDTTPNAFEFAPQTNAERATTVNSNAVTITGINTPAPIAITQGEYAINSGNFTAASTTIAPGQSVVVRLTTSDDFSTRNAATLTIGGISADFSVTTLAADTTPETFSFNAQADVERNQAVESEAVTIEGINTGAAITISNGEYAIDGGAFTAAEGTIEAGQSVVVRVTASNEFEATTTATLTIGDIDADFSVTTLAADTTPEAFSFSTQADVERNQTVESEAATIEGINTGSAITISNGEYAIDGGAFTAADGSIEAGQSVVVRVTASNDFDTTTTATLTIGDIATDFSVTTLAADTTPETFSFSAQADVERNQTVESEAVTIEGINTDSAITISNGEYAIDGGAFTATDGTIEAGQSVVVRVTASNEFSTTTTATLTIGDIATDFSVTTLAADTTPETFSFSAQADTERNQTVESEAVTIEGINTGAAITISNGEYAIGGGAFTAAEGIIEAGQSVVVRVTASNEFSTTTTATLTIGDIATDFSVTTLAADTTPETFSFNAQADVERNQTVESEAVTIEGINTGAAITISNGEYAIDGGAFTAADGSIEAGQSVVVRVTASNEFDTTTTATLTIGDIARNFSVTTLAADTTPETFSFNAQADVERNQTVESEAVTIEGINTGAAITISNGEYAIDGGAFTAADGTIEAGQSVVIRVSASNEFSTTTTATLTIGGISADFSVTTLAADTLPTAFSFNAEADALPGSTVSSNPITIEGINTGSAITISNGEYAIDGGAFTASAGEIAPGQQVVVRLVAANSFSTSTTATLTIGGVSANFEATTVAEDTSPDAFSFAPLTGAVFNEVVVSDAITVVGINSSAAIAISGGEYALDGGSFTSSAGEVNANQSVVVRVTAANTFNTPTTATLTIGGVSGQFTATTVADSQAPSAVIDFPLPNAYTTHNSIRVRGRASDAEGNVITSVQVNGIEATSTDGFATWSANLTLTEGDNSITVTAQDQSDNINNNADSAEIFYRSDEDFFEPTAAVLDTLGNQAYVIDRQQMNLSQVDLDSGARSILAGEMPNSDGLAVGTGPELSDARGLAVDLVTNRAYVSDVSEDTVFSIDLATGDRTVLSGFASSGLVGTGPSFMFPATLALDSTNNRLLVLDEGSQVLALISINIATGNRTVIANASTGSGVDFDSPTSFVLDSDNNRALVIDGSTLLSVDLDTGNRTVLSGNDRDNGDALVGSGDTFTNPTAIALDSINSRVFIGDVDEDENGAIIEVDLATGNRTVFANATLGNGPIPLAPQSMALDNNTNRLLVLDSNYGLIAADLTSANRTAIRERVGSGPDLEELRAPALDREHNRLFVLDGNEIDQSIYAVDLTTGERSVFSSNSVGTGTDIVLLESLKIDADNDRLLAVDHLGRRVIAIDLDSGDRSILVDGTTGTGTELLEPFDFVVDTSNNRVLAADLAQSAVLGLDLITANREIVTGENFDTNETIGSGIEIFAPLVLDLAPTPGTGLLIDDGVDALYEFDLTTGDRTIVTGANINTGDITGSGPDLILPIALAVDNTNNRAYLLDQDGNFIVSVDLTSGDRTLITGTNPLDDSPTGFGPDLNLPFGLEFDAEANLLFVTNFDAIMAVDLVTGNRILISDGALLNNRFAF